MNYTHLSREERYQICLMKRQGHNCTQIALELGRHRSSISREIKRNICARGYKANAADVKAHSRQSQRRNAKEFTAEHWRVVDALIRLEFSPQQIAHRLVLEQSFSISTEAIYQRILRDKQTQGELAKHLPALPEVSQKALRQRARVARQHQRPGLHRKALQGG